jgi:hypothetical protein
MTVLVVIATPAIALFALAWWSSGRARAIEHNPLATSERAEAEVRTMKEYRPHGPGPAI